MSWRLIVKAACQTRPFRDVLVLADKAPFGHRLLNRLSRPSALFDNVEHAWAGARAINPLGHEDPWVIELHLELSKSLRASDYAVLFWILQISGGDVSIFDYSGNVGNLYYSFSPYLQNCRSVRWRVYDLPQVVQEGRRIAEARNAAGLTFESLPDAVGSQDILLVSGALHYWERSISEFLRQFAEQPKHILINRSPVHDTLSFITVQRTQKCAFPCVVRNTREMIEGFASEGYKLIDRWKAVELSLTMPFFPNHTIPCYSGFYFRRE